MPNKRLALSRRSFLTATPAALFGTSDMQDHTASRARTPSGVVADPGDVQRTIDQAANRNGFAHGNYTRVGLQTGTTYASRRTWQVKRGVILDFNGAKVVPAGDRDVVHLHPEAHLVRPFIDARNRNYSATAITLDTQYGKYGGPNRSTVEQAHLLSNPANGTAIALHDRNSEGIWDAHFSGMAQGFDTAILLRASGGSNAFVNSNHFDMTTSAYTTAVKHRGVAGAAVNGNHFDLIAQPSATSRHLWDLGGEAAFNTMEADVWDKRMYQDGSQIVRFNGGDNTLVDRFGYTNAAHARGGGRITSPHGTDSRTENGNGNDNQNDDGGTTLVVEGTGSYTVVVEGSVQAASDVENGKLFGGDTINEDGPQAGTMSIKGDVVGGKDVYTVYGQVLRQQTWGDIQITVDGSSV